MIDTELKVSGGILIYRLYDVAWDIDLEKVEEKVREYKRQGIDRKRFSKAFEFANPPVSLTLTPIEKIINGKQYTINIYAKAYDYGVLSIICEIPVKEIGIADFETLAKNTEEPFQEDFRREVDRLVSDLGETFRQVNRSRFEEDYTIYYLKQLGPDKTAHDLLKSLDIGSLLLFEEGESSPSEVTKGEFLPFRFSYSDNDLVVLSWDKAFVLEPSGSMDIPDLLEFANSQLLELRVYDDMVDRELDIINEQSITRMSPSLWKIRRYEELAERVMRTVTDFTAVTEKIDNALKVTEDVYYAKVYAAALSLFKVRDWETSIERKISIASRVYDMLYRVITNKRTELLELIIVILIGIEIALFLLVRM